ncbi:MAG: hypothetical protein PHX68_01775 [Alphaproteobacteria bacterium]|nr:hypothetical protein [Alphaproteobacteria bacterium]
MPPKHVSQGPQSAATEHVLWEQSAPAHPASQWQMPSAQVALAGHTTPSHSKSAGTFSASIGVRSLLKTNRSLGWPSIQSASVAKCPSEL